jgi:hypothetical protein
MLDKTDAQVAEILSALQAITPDVEQTPIIITDHFTGFA